MNNKIFFYLGLLLLAMNCGNNSNLLPLELNNGQQWIINSEMVPHIERSEKLVTQFMEDGDSNYLKLAEALKENNQLLISSCTMKGKSHDELHKWLHPYIKMVSDLSKAKSSNESKEILQQITNSFDTYHQYFK